jgi:hypothetical protein
MDTLVHWYTKPDWDERTAFRAGVEATTASVIDMTTPDHLAVGAWQKSFRCRSVLISRFLNAIPPCDGIRILCRALRGGARGRHHRRRVRAPAGRGRAWQMLLATSYNAVQLKKRGLKMRVVDDGIGRYCSPRHCMPLYSSNTGSKCVPMPWGHLAAIGLADIARILHVIGCLVPKNFKCVG